MPCFRTWTKPAPPVSVTLPGAFVGVLLATGSAAQAGGVQVMVLISLLLAQACGVAVTGELVARGHIARRASVAPVSRGWSHRIARLIPVVGR